MNKITKLWRNTPTLVKYTMIALAFYLVVGSAIDFFSNNDVVTNSEQLSTFEYPLYWE